MTNNNIMGGGANLLSGTVPAGWTGYYGMTVDPNSSLPAPVSAIFSDVKTVNLIDEEEEEFECSSIGE